jgi:hypothetical protein
MSIWRWLQRKIGSRVVAELFVPKPRPPLSALAQEYLRVANEMTTCTPGTWEYRDRIRRADQIWNQLDEREQDAIERELAQEG